MLISGSKSLRKRFIICENFLRYLVRGSVKASTMELLSSQKKNPEGSNLFVYTQMLGYLLTCIAQTNVFFSYAYTLHFYSSHNHFCLEKRELQY